MPWLLAGSSFLASVGGGVAFAQNDSAPVTLDWQAPACANTSSPEVLAEVLRLLGGNVSSAKAVDARIRVEAIASGAGRTTRFRVAIITRIEGRDGQRLMEVASCAEAVQASALIVALAVDPTRVAAQTQAASVDAGGVAPSPASASVTSPSAATDAGAGAADIIDARSPEAAADAAVEVVGETPAPVPTPAAAKSTDATEASETTEARERPWSIGASAHANLGMLPKLAPGAAIHGGHQWRALRVELGLHFLGAQSSGSAQRAGDFSALGGDLRGCWFLLDAHVELGPCLLAAGDRIAATAPRVSAPSNESAGLLSLGGGVLFTARIVPAVRFRVSLDALVPAGRPSFSVVSPTSTTEVHRVSAAVLRGAAGLELRL